MFHRRGTLESVLVLGVLSGVLVASGCGGSSSPPDSPDDQALNDVDPEWDTGPSVGQKDDDTAAGLEGNKASDEKEMPDFRDGMSVNEAAAAVPQHYDFVGIEQEALAKPLQDPETFKDCNPGSQHFTAKVAVWDGKAVGIDIDTKSPKLKECLLEKIKRLEWPDKEESINTVEYTY